jgi:tetratricopeptide (TPR) repeat protein
MGFFNRLFGKRQKASQGFAMHEGFFFPGGGQEAYFNFRERKLTQRAAQRIEEEIPATAASPIWAIIMECGEPGENSWLLYALGDGDTILYTSNGGLAGGGGSADQFVPAFIDTANRCLEHLRPAKSFPVPAAGNCTFYAITDAGVLTATGSLDDLGNDRHPLSPLYHAGHEVITHVRYASSWRAWVLSWLKGERGMTGIPEHTATWGVLSELGGHAAVPGASIFASVNGNAGIYSGTGTLFKPEQLPRELRRANDHLIATADRLLQRLQPTESFPFPNLDHVVFYVGTQTGVLCGGGTVEELESGSHPLSPLYEARQAVFRAASQGLGQDRPVSADVEASYNRGVASAQKGAWEQAIAAFSEVIRLMPDCAEAYGSRGSAHSEKGDQDRAIADLSEAIRLKPSLGQAYNDRGRAYAKKGDSERAIADCTIAIQLKPQFAAAYNNRGIGYVIRGDLDRAVADFTEAIRIAPDFAAPYRNRGFAFSEQGHLEPAIAEYNVAIRLEPDVAETYHIRGLAYQKQGLSGKAAADFQKAQELTR